MKIEIIAKNYKPADKLKEIIEKKLDKFSRYFDENTIARVMLKELNKDKYAMEITVNFDGGKIMRSEVVSDNMYDNIDMCLPKLERQVRKFKTKQNKKVKEAPIVQPIYETEPEIKELEIARVKPTALKRMTVKDAITELELLGHTFYVFVNEDNGMCNIVYLREAGGVGLLDLIY